MTDFDTGTPLLFDLDCPYADSLAVIIGVPYDGTASYRKGTRLGPDAMRNESYGLESFSPYLNSDIDGAPIFDFGNLEFPAEDPQSVLSTIEKAVRGVLSDGKVPVLLGGEHLITLGAIRAISEKYENLHILHFDAHADLRDDYLGEKLSHATVLRRCHELVGDGRIFQFGIRSGTRDEFDFANTHTACRRFDFEGFEDTIQKLSGVPVYVTIDLDVLDPSVFPGTGTPEAGGVSFEVLLRAVHLLTGLEIVGMDLCELSPPCDPSGISTVTADKIFRELMLTWLKSRTKED